MLTMKHTWKAVMTLGLALLLGPALAVAQDNTINLNGTMADAPMPFVYAQETLPAMADAMGRRALELENEMDIAVAPRRAIIADEIYLRIDLSGAQFGAIPTAVSGVATGDLSPNTGSSLSSGGAGMSHAVFRLGAVEASELVGVQIGDNSGDEGDLRVTATTGNVTATIAAYTDPDDALDQEGARGTFAGSAAIIQLTSGLTVTIKAAPKVTASVDTGFMRFLGGGGTARLGWLGLEENETVMAGVRSAVTGVQLVRGNILTTDPDSTPAGAAIGMISFNVMGNLDIGAFTVKPETFQRVNAEDATSALVMMDGAPVPTGTCDGGMEDTVDRGTLVAGMPAMQLIGEEGELPSGADSAGTGDLAPGIHLLCLNVDVTGLMSNMSAIPEGGYSATAHYKGTATALAQMAGEGMLASIDRDGAEVHIPYLTTYDKHNQRLIIVNRGTRAAAITSFQFTTEDGTEVELTPTVQRAMDAGLLAVPGNSTFVARMDETLNITGNSRRVSASLSFAATVGALSVATTQVNFSDGSTDTVVYEVMD